ncbi:MAG: flagellar hook-basal body complex protein [Robiginitomaculum sp.]|nr:flagellar hook-basal body complex protein [Robiginitomaculum sp.]
MDNSNYISISRQSGLLKEMNVIANNIANASTTGFRRESAIFSEFVVQAGADNPAAHTDRMKSSVAIGRLGAHYSDFTSGSLSRTGGALDLAIEGDGFFLIGTPNGEHLSRAGRFMTNQDGSLVTPDGHFVLDEAGSSIQIPPDAGLISIGGDGTISAGGEPLGKIGLVNADQANLTRIGGNLWQAKDGFTPVENPTIVQGYLEDSNVNPVLEMARMIEVQRAYEAGQKLLEIVDERVAKTISAIRQPP